MRRSSLLLLAGSFVGLAAAVAGLGVSLEFAGSGPRSGVAATVAGHEIASIDVERLVAAMASERGGRRGDRARVLERLIDEQLLLVRALDLGLADRDPRIRGELVQAVIRSVVAEHEDAEPSEKELRRFFETNRDMFSNSARLRTGQVFVRSTSASDQIALERARQAAARLRQGQTLAEAKESFGDPSGLVLPDAFLTPAKLRDYLGPTAARTLLSMEAGQVSDPVRVSGGYRVLVLLGREEPTAPSLEGLRPQVIAEYRRRLGEDAVKRYLVGLRKSYEVVVFDAGTEAGGQTE